MPLRGEEMMKKTWRWTWKDTLLVMFILLCTFVFVQKWAVSEELDIADTTFEITFRGENQHSFMLQNIQPGDRVYQKGSSVVFGNVVEVEAKPAKKRTFNERTGSLYMDEYPSRYHIVLTVEAEGFRSPHGSTVIDNNNIELNQYFVVETDRTRMPTRVISIENKG